MYISIENNHKDDTNKKQLIYHTISFPVVIISSKHTIVLLGKPLIYFKKILVYTVVNTIVKIL